MKLSGTQIRSLIEKKEDERVEFKRASSELPDNIYDFFFKIHDRVTGDVKIPFKIAADGITRIDDTPVLATCRNMPTLPYAARWGGRRDGLR